MRVGGRGGWRTDRLSATPGRDVGFAGRRGGSESSSEQEGAEETVDKESKGPQVGGGVGRQGTTCVGTIKQGRSRDYSGADDYHPL